MIARAYVARKSRRIGPGTGKPWVKTSAGAGEKPGLFRPNLEAA